MIPALPTALLRILLGSHENLNLLKLSIMPARPQQRWGQAASGGLEARGARLTPLTCIRRANRSCTENRGGSLQRTQEQRTSGMGILQRHGERDLHMNTSDVAASQRRRTVCFGDVPATQRYNVTNSKLASDNCAWQLLRLSRKVTATGPLHNPCKSNVGNRHRSI